MLYGLRIGPSSPCIYKLLRVVVGFLRKNGIRLVIYLDDLLFINDSRDGVLNDLKVAVDLLESLGFLGRSQLWFPVR